MAADGKAGGGEPWQPLTCRFGLLQSFLTLHQRQGFRVLTGMCSGMGTLPSTMAWAFTLPSPALLSEDNRRGLPTEGLCGFRRPFM